MRSSATAEMLARFLSIAFFLALNAIGADPLAVGSSPGIRYGNNSATGAYASVNGIKLYYETYGTGQPMLQIHGNGGSISGMRRQIEFFAPRYKIVAADSRGHGKSELGPGRLTYEQMADDLNALLDQLGSKPVYVIGWSDGGILGLLLAIHHPDKVEKLAIMGANLVPEGAYDWARAYVDREDERAVKMIAQGDTNRNWALVRQHLDLLGKQPNISIKDLAKINIPVLVMAGDKDVIKDDHTLQIFHALPKAHLAIFPGATHGIPAQNPELFNRTVERFFTNSFTRPDTRDTIK